MEQVWDCSMVEVLPSSSSSSCAAAYAIWTLVTCWIAWSVIGGLFGGIRVSEEEETQGLDIGERNGAYPDFASAK